MNNKILSIILFILILSGPALANAATPSRQLGRILLQVQARGEAWYVSPVSKVRTYLKDGQAAFSLLCSEGLGIKAADLKKIPVGLNADDRVTDSDADGYPDFAEVSAGYDPSDSTAGAKPKIDMKLTKKLSGRILLDVEHAGQAWYLNPGDLKRYYMKDGNAAYALMRKFGLGITNADLAAIPQKAAATPDTTVHIGPGVPDSPELPSAELDAVKAAFAGVRDAYLTGDKEKLKSYSLPAFAPLIDGLDMVVPQTFEYLFAVKASDTVYAVQYRVALPGVSTYDATINFQKIDGKWLLIG